MALEDVLGDVTPEYLEGLRRSDDLGADDFSEAVDAYTFVRDVAVAAAATDPRYLKQDVLTNLEAFLVELRDGKTPQIREFRWSDDAAGATHQEITTRAHQVRDWTLDNAVPWIQHGEVDSAKAAADAAAIAQARRDAESIVSTLRQTAGESGSMKLSGFYRKEKEGFHTQATVLAVLMAGAVAALVFFGWMFFFGPWEIDDTGSQDWQDLVKDLVVRVFFLGIAAWALAFLARTYRVARHLEVVNAQKEAALNTYPLFIEALSSDQQRDIATAELARSVLQGADSGFITADRERTVVETSSVSGLLSGRGGSLPPG